MRILGVDLGTKRIGIAVAEAEFGVATARPALASAGSLAKDADQILAVARREEVREVVVGLPLDSGEETRMSGVMRRFADLLRERGLIVHLVDESLTSVASEQSLLDAGLKASHRRKLRDGEAARHILLRYLDAQKGRSELG